MLSQYLRSINKIFEMHDQDRNDIWAKRYRHYHSLINIRNLFT